MKKNTPTPLSTPSQTPAHPPDHFAWRPRAPADGGLNTNPFEAFDYRGSISDLSQAAFQRQSEIRDATRDTAPLQGSKDISDDDSLDGASGH